MLWKIFQKWQCILKKKETEDIDDEVVEWILMKRKIGIAVASWEDMVKAWSLNEELKKRSMNPHQKWRYRLLVRNHLIISAGTHIGQELPENYREKNVQIHKIKWSLLRIKLFRTVSNSKYGWNSDIFKYGMNQDNCYNLFKTVNIKTHGQD